VNDIFKGDIPVVNSLISCNAFVVASSPLPPPNNSNDNGRSDNDTTNNATSGNDGRTWEEFDRTSTTQLELDDLLVHTPDWTLCAGNVVCLLLLLPPPVVSHPH
jgi:hypothetical protein